MEIDENSNSTSSHCYQDMNNGDEVVEYHQLVQNSELFFNKLKSFHSSFNTHFITPCIGGTPLDLHRLFVEVTSRGGLDRVINERKWENVVSAFSTEITSFKRSFLLRKYYLSLLYQFEQAYFLKKKAPSTTITDAVKQINIVGSNEFPSNGNEEFITASHLQGSIQLQPGISLIGVIDEKLDNGYVVSVNVGRDTLKGILYHIPESPQGGPLPSGGPNPSVPRRRRRKKSQMSLTPYGTLNPISQGQDNSISNAGRIWNQLSEPGKQLHGDSNGVMSNESNHSEVVSLAINS